MTNHLSFEQLCDLTDGALHDADEQHARGHLLQCADCSARLSEITELATGTAALPREVAPPADLWSDIKQQLKPRRSASAERNVRWPLRRLAAAAVAIAIGSSALTALVLRGRQANSLATATLGDVRTLGTRVGPQPAQLPARLASAENRYSRSVDVLERTLAERRDSLAPSTVAIVERSLRVADSAIAEARAALARDPANRALAALFASNYERKIDLLRRATELAPRT